VDICSPTVFVVDDETATRDSVVALASAMRLECQSYSSAEQFLSAFQPAQMGCAVIDIHLDGMDGLELQEQLIRREYAIPIVVTGAYLNVPIAVRAMQNGAVTVLEKPCLPNQLAEAILKGIEISREEQEIRNRRAILRSRFESLEPREQEVMTRIVNGMPSKTIARDLYISQRTVARIRSAIFEKMGADTAVDLAQMAIEFWGVRQEDNL
jgi:two-component system, LuxR family, response regulator FixJ